MVIKMASFYNHHLHLLRCLFLIVQLFLAGKYQGVAACSDILVTPKASTDGTAMIAYNADDLTLYGVLYHYPPTQGLANDNITIYEWDTGVSISFFVSFLY